MVAVTIHNSDEQALGPFLVLSRPVSEQRVVERVAPGEESTVHLHELDSAVDEVLVSLLDDNREVVERKNEGVVDETSAG